jgi:hypothetical protein
VMAEGQVLAIEVDEDIGEHEDDDQRDAKQNDDEEKVRLLWGSCSISMLDRMRGGMGAFALKRSGCDFGLGGRGDLTDDRCSGY